MLETESGGNPVSVRPATENDAEQLLRIYAPYVQKTAISFEYIVPSPEEFRKRIHAVLEQYPYLVAETDGCIKGYSYASPFKSRKAYQHSVEMTVYIEENSRGKGIGRILYTEMERILLAQGILNLNSCIGYTSRPDDPYLTNSSMHFHEHMGYRLIGRFTKCGYKFDQWYDMIWMEKLIGEHGLNVPEFRTFPDVRSASGVRQIPGL